MWRIFKTIWIGQKKIHFHNIIQDVIGSRFIKSYRHRCVSSLLFRRRSVFWVFFLVNCQCSSNIYYIGILRNYRAAPTTAYNIILPPATAEDVRCEQVTRGGVSICPIIARGINHRRFLHIYLIFGIHYTSSTRGGHLSNVEKNK